VAGVLLALAVAGWWPRLLGWSPFDGLPRVTQLGAELSREHLLAAGGSTILHWPWSARTDGASAVSGDIVWDGAGQVGYLQFTGLEPNEPSRHQYQLWIVDATRDERYPVDGGVFDVREAPGPVVVPIRASLPVREPVAFLVTLEKAGGAVVSSRERVVAVAHAGGR
jgi:hypothetical protein